MGLCCVFGVNPIPNRCLQSIWVAAFMTWWCWPTGSGRLLYYWKPDWKFGAAGSSSSSCLAAADDDALNCVASCDASQREVPLVVLPFLRLLPVNLVLTKLSNRKSAHTHDFFLLYISPEETSCICLHIYTWGGLMCMITGSYMYVSSWYAMQNSRNYIARLIFETSGSRN